MRTESGPPTRTSWRIRRQNLVDGVDVPLSMTRAELATLCEAELGGIKTLLRGCLEEAATDAGSLAGAQAFGGGCRMPIVQDVVRDEVWLRDRTCSVWCFCDSS